MKHGIKTGEYFTIKNATINVTSAVGDGINCEEYFLMESGTINFSGTQDDGIQCDIDGDASTGETDDHEDEDSGNVYIEGGTIIVIGGLESGAQLTQSCYQTSSWSKNTWYAMTIGSDTFVFKTPSSGGNTMVVSGASQPTLKSGVTVSGGTSIFDGVAYTGATFTSGSNVTLSSYTGGGGGPGGGGQPGSGGGPCVQ